MPFEENDISVFGARYAERRNPVADETRRGLLGFIEAKREKPESLIKLIPQDRPEKIIFKDLKALIQSNEKNINEIKPYFKKDFYLENNFRLNDYLLAPDLNIRHRPDDLAGLFNPVREFQDRDFGALIELFRPNSQNVNRTQFSPAELRDIGAELVPLGNAETQALLAAHRARVTALAEKIIEAAQKEDGAWLPRTKDVISLIEAYSEKRENPKVGDIVALIGQGPAAFKAHFGRVLTYSPFQPGQLEAVFNRACRTPRFGPLERMLDGKNRGYFRIEIEKAGPTESEIAAALSVRGYKITDYQAGTATEAASGREGKQSFKIGKLLKDHPALLKKFEDDPYRTLDRVLVVVSKDPEDVARMSTGRAWKPCMAAGGGHGVNNFHFVPDEVAAGTFVVYLVRASDPLIHDPLSRVSVKPFTPSNDLDQPGKAMKNIFDRMNKIGPKETTALFRPGPCYGLRNHLFYSAVMSLCQDTLNAGLAGTFIMAPGLYDDGMKRVVTRRAETAPACAMAG